MSDLPQQPPDPRQPKPDNKPNSADDAAKRAQGIAGANLVNALKKAEENWLMTMEIFTFQARNLRGKYDAALAQGFNETQALFLCTQTWNN